MLAVGHTQQHNTHLTQQQQEGSPVEIKALMPTQHTRNEEEDVDDDDVAVADDDDDYVYEQMMMMTGSRVFNLCLFKHLPRCIDNASRRKEVCTEICNF